MHGWWPSSAPSVGRGAFLNSTGALYNRAHFGRPQVARFLDEALFQIDLRRDRFMKLWRVSGDKVEATAAVIQRSDRYTAAVHYRYADGRSRTWSWRTRDGTYLNGREIVQCINSIDRGFRAIPGVHVRIDFPHNASREEQMLILMDYGLLRLFEDSAQQEELPEVPDSAAQ